MSKLLELEKVSKVKKRKIGFMQSRYYDKESEIQVLLHHCQPNVKLDLHKHVHVQYGYNFWGNYLFFIENDLIHISSNNSYLINKYIPHEAIAENEYYSVDIKFHGKEEFAKEVNLPFVNNEIILKAVNKKIVVKKLMEGDIVGNKMLLMTSHELKLQINNLSYHLFPMNIYRVLLGASEDTTSGIINKIIGNGEVLGVDIVEY